MPNQKSTVSRVDRNKYLLLILPILLLLLAFIVYWFASAKNVAKPIEVVDFSQNAELDSNNSRQPKNNVFNLADKTINLEPTKVVTQVSVTALPAPAKKLEVLLEQSGAQTQAETLNQAITNAEQSLENLDKRLSALGYHPDVVGEIPVPIPSLNQRLKDIKTHLKQ